MFSSRRKPVISNSASLTSLSPSLTSSDNSYTPKNRRPSPVALRQLSVHNLDTTNRRNRNVPPTRQRELNSLSRSTVTIPHPPIHLPEDNSVWIPIRRSVYAQESSSSSSPNLTSRAQHSEQPFYQIALPPNPLPSPIQYQIVPFRTRQPSPIHTRRDIRRKKKYLKEKTTGLCATLCSGGFGTLAAIIYICVSLALPGTKLALGIIYMQSCPIDSRIPIYMIISGACGISIMLLIIFSSSCRLYRASIAARKSTHRFIVFSIGFARGIQVIVAIFLFVWFFIGNFWVFGARYRVQTDYSNNTSSNYCHPALYWFAFYVLIITYIVAFLLFFFKFITSFCCCRALDIWKRAFT